MKNASIYKHIPVMLDFFIRGSFDNIFISESSYVLVVPDEVSYADVYAI